ncbi:baseplate J/gp47 family protein [Leptothoe spongobia]|uniref:Baseplate J/gp47 family protein n=1 Tax=Leptothoe spongobia TAU-MAC 1115 TaxID=1967444 RepID=A0A947DGE3_9CYAN|nr:baseplate J/gp47 family protein [Leptothoe spongobia]MBT9316275.1 baseplate J/gp47 family protein [Leptothoe spongobia TAU-MAC 1115]
MSDRVDFLTWQEILDKLLSLLPPQWRANFTGKVLKRLLVAFSLSLEALYALLAKVLRLAIISTSEGQWLRALVAGFGMESYAGVAATAQLQFSRFGSVDTDVVIPTGTEIQAGNGARFTTDLEISLVAGQSEVLVPATCTLPGTIGNIATGEALELKTGIQGIDEVSNPYPAIGGVAAESDASIRSRVPVYLAMLHRATIPATEGAIASDPVTYPDVIDFQTERNAGVPGYFRGVVTEATNGDAYQPGQWFAATGFTQVWYTVISWPEINGLVKVGWPCKRFGEVTRDESGKEVWSASASIAGVEQGFYRWFFDAPTQRLYIRTQGQDPNTLELVLLTGITWRVLQDLENSWAANGVHVDVIV